MKQWVYGKAGQHVAIMALHQGVIQRREQKLSVRFWVVGVLKVELSDHLLCNSNIILNEVH